MKYAENIDGVLDAFEQSPLREEDLDGFYYKETMGSRTGDAYVSPIQDIYDACKRPSLRNTFLLLGHRGCGKSTELNKMSVDLKEDGYCVHTAYCAADLDLINPVSTDLLILIGDALLSIAEKTGCEISEETKSRLISFWIVEIEEMKTIVGGAAIAAEIGVQTETPKFLSGFLRFFGLIKGNLRHSQEKRTTYKDKITPRASEWVRIMNEIADKITAKNVKQPIVIFEDLDKINPGEAFNIFSNHAATLTGFTFPVVYTFPIELSYDPRFAALLGFYIPKTLPMIKLETMKGDIYQAGIDAIRNIVDKRVRLDLFEEGVLNTLIKKTGGSLRDLFRCITTSAQRAARRESKSISQEDIKAAMTQLKSELTRRIEKKHYDFLVNIYRGNRQEIADKDMLLEMLKANVVLEYNADRWNNVHPLVVDFLSDVGSM